MSKDKKEKKEKKEKKTHKRKRSEESDDDFEQPHIEKKLKVEDVEIAKENTENTENTVSEVLPLAAQTTQDDLKDSNTIQPTEEASEAENETQTEEQEKKPEPEQPKAIPTNQTKKAIRAMNRSKQVVYAIDEHPALEYLKSFGTDDFKFNKNRQSYLLQHWPSEQRLPTAKQFRQFLTYSEGIQGRARDELISVIQNTQKAFLQIDDEVLDDEEKLKKYFTDNNITQYTSIASLQRADKLAKQFEIPVFKKLKKEQKNNEEEKEQVADQ